MHDLAIKIARPDRVAKAMFLAGPEHALDAARTQLDRHTAPDWKMFWREVVVELMKLEAR